MIHFEFIGLTAIRNGLTTLRPPDSVCDTNPLVRHFCKPKKRPKEDVKTQKWERTWTRVIFLLFSLHFSRHPHTTSSTNSSGYFSQDFSLTKKKVLSMVSYLRIGCLNGLRICITKLEGHLLSEDLRAQFGHRFRAIIIWKILKLIKPRFPSLSLHNSFLTNLLWLKHLRLQKCTLSLRVFKSENPKSKSYIVNGIFLLH